MKKSMEILYNDYCCILSAFKFFKDFANNYAIIEWGETTVTSLSSSHNSHNAMLLSYDGIFLWMNFIWKVKKHEVILAFS